MEAKPANLPTGSVSKKKSKAERLERAERLNIYEKELRQPDRRRSAIALVGNAPPIKFLRSPLVEARPEQLSRAANKGTPYVIDFQTAEAQYKCREAHQLQK